jgi:hypothetical protein
VADHINRPPRQSWQQYDATDAGSTDEQSAATTLYAGAGGADQAEPFMKVQDGGAAPDGTITGGFPDDPHLNDGSKWRQT